MLLLGVSSWSSQGGTTSTTPPATGGGWDWNAAGAALGAGAQQFAQSYQGNSTQTGTPTFYRNQFNQMWNTLMPGINDYLSAANAAGANMDQARGLLLSSMGPTDISEMLADRRRALNFNGQLYQPFREAIGTISDFRNQLGSGTTVADVAAGRQMQEAQRQLAMTPGMTAATRGAALTGAREQMAEASYKERLGQYGQATAGLAGAQTALGQAQMQGMQIAANLAAQIAGIRSDDAMRIMQGSTALAQMAVNDPRLAAQYAIFQARARMIENATGRTQSNKGSNTGAYIGAAASVVGAVIVAA